MDPQAGIGPCGLINGQVYCGRSRGIEWRRSVVVDVLEARLDEVKSVGIDSVRPEKEPAVAVRHRGGDLLHAAFRRQKTDFQVGDRPVESFVQDLALDFPLRPQSRRHQKAKQEKIERGEGARSN